MQIVSALTCSIWIAHNNKVQNKNRPVHKAVELALKSSYDYQRHLCENRLQTVRSNTSVVRNNISWSPPPMSFLKLNVDAHLSDDGRWGFGLSCGGMMVAALEQQPGRVMDRTM
ncbi:hypothetical protein A2U01_0049561 [Trifolium medium]|uniref:Uncharacterized protein n=1 Tax=Trifolium medium TaxID=97028 RepID=A0A392QVG9_9FABA|nr:hypothetical protein [Trifolium medium]